MGSIKSLTQEEIVPHARADFQIFQLNEHLGENEGGINTDFAFQGAESSEHAFNIATAPFGPGFIQYQVSNVDSLSHEILINGQPLPAVDVHLTGSQFLTHTDIIPEQFLRFGSNTFRFRRRGNDNFLIHAVIVHWREVEP